MDAKLLRSIGIAAGAAAIAGALALSQGARQAEQAESATLPQIADAPAPLLQPAPIAERAEAASSYMSLLVRFQGGGPLGQAQALAERGREAQAARAARAALARQNAFRGLCFERFTLGGAEMVLRSCAPIPVEQQREIIAEWLTRLRAMSAVVYAEQNASADVSETQ